MPTCAWCTQLEGSAGFDAPFSLAGATLILLRCTGSQGPFRDPDTVTLHGVVTVAALAGHETA